jgi:hypothetical protein
MATHIDGGAVRTFNFASAISAYRFVEVHTDGTARAAVSGSARAIGSTISDVAAGDNGSVKLFYPTFFATCEDGIIAMAGLVATTGSGLVTTAAANTGVVGVALETALADAVIEVAVPLTQ